MQGADRGNIARCEHRIEIHASLKELHSGSTALAFVGSGVDLEFLVRFDPGRMECPAISAPAFLNLGKARAGGADERDPSATTLEKVGCRVKSALLIV